MAALGHWGWAALVWCPALVFAKAVHQGVPDEVVVDAVSECRFCAAQHPVLEELMTWVKQQRAARKQVREE